MSAGNTKQVTNFSEVASHLLPLIHGCCVVLIVTEVSADVLSLSLQHTSGLGLDAWGHECDIFGYYLSVVHCSTTMGTCSSS